MKKKKFSVFQLIVCIYLCLFGLLLLTLIVWGFLSSVKDPLFDFRKNLLGLPKSWKFSNYMFVYNNFFVEVINDTGNIVRIGMARQVGNTLMFCFIRAGFGTICPCLVGYLVAKYKYKFSSVVYGVALIVMALPIVGAYPSEIALLLGLGIYDTIIGLCLQSSSFLGLYFFVFYATFSSISNDFYDAASIDGASEFTIFVKIMLPMVFTSFTTIFLLLFIGNWNDYQYALLYLPSYPTLSYGLYVLSNSPLQELNNVPMRMAGCFIVMIPILILFIALKDKIMSNVSMGGLKE